MRRDGKMTVNVLQCVKPGLTDRAFVYGKPIEIGHRDGSFAIFLWAAGMWHELTMV